MTEMCWKHRELTRFSSGEYKPVPVALDYPAEHFIHLSVTETESDTVAYTPSSEYGERDRQVRLKFGRYLKKTFPTFTDAEIQAHVTSLKSALAVIDAPATLCFATDVETINRIFETRMRACGSNADSCMFGKFDDDEIRPYHVYANSPDVAVAYVIAHGNIVSRSVVSTKDHRWVRCYSIAGGDNDADCGTLRALLKDAGYTKGDLCGNRLTKLDTSDVMLPYIDEGGMGVHDRGAYWVVCEENEGDYNADCTDGTATEAGDRCDVCERHTDDCECYVCECCDSRTLNGCEDCLMCEQCDSCIEHDNCDCDRCSDCHNIINPRSRYTESCDCDRCGECNELEDDCDCSKCDECGRLADDCECEQEEEEEEEDEGEEPAIALNADVTLTHDEARHKLNHAYTYLRDTYGLDSTSAEYRILKAALDNITVPMEMAA